MCLLRLLGKKHLVELMDRLTANNQCSSYAKHTTSKYYFYMWRFGWVFYLMALVLDVFGFFASLLAPCSRLASGFSGLIIGAALFFFTIAASLMT